MVSYGDNNKGKILDFETIGKFLNPTMGGVLLVKRLKHNLLSISQLYEKGNSVTFNSSGCRIIKSKSNETIFTSSRSGNTYTISLNKIPSSDVCLLRNEDEYWLWHRRITHIHMDHLNKLVCKDIIDGMPNLYF